MITKHFLKSITCVSLTEDDFNGYSGSKNGVISQWDLEKQKNIISIKAKETNGGIELLAMDISFDGLILAVGGKGCSIQVYDTRSMQLVTSLSGHNKSITGLSFNDLSYDVYSCSLDHSLNVWSIKERCLVQSLFGHTSPILCLDCRTQSRPISGGSDGSCRLWKVEEQSQLVYKNPSTSIDCCKYITNNQWVTGDQEGRICLWSTSKRKPVFMKKFKTNNLIQNGSGSIQENSAGWISSLSVSNDSNLIAVGSGDGVIRFIKNCQGTSLNLVGAIPIRGFVNGLKLSKSARFLIAGIGQEPRLGRWSSDKSAKNEVVIKPINIESFHL